MLRHLPGLDLNLLVALDALLGEAHVTRAAKRVGLSQSAMSHALGRLRELFDDPLLVRGPRGMLLTARALELAAPLAETLARLDGLVGPPSAFDPSAVERELAIAAIDWAGLVILPALMSDLARRAPGISLTAVPPVEPVERALADGSVDLAIGLTRPETSLRQQRITSDRFVCLIRRGHPLCKRLTLKRYAELSHVLVSPRGRVPGAADAVLRERGLERRVVLVAPHALAAALFVARSDAVVTLAERVARIVARGLPLRLLPPPLPLAPFGVSLQWHARHDLDPAHAFVRDRIAQIADT